MLDLPRVLVFELCMDIKPANLSGLLHYLIELILFLPKVLVIFDQNQILPIQVGVNRLVTLTLNLSSVLASFYGDQQSVYLR